MKSKFIKLTYSTTLNELKCYFTFVFITTEWTLEFSVSICDGESESPETDSSRALLLQKNV